MAFAGLEIRVSSNFSVQGHYNVMLMVWLLILASSTSPFPPWPARAGKLEVCVCVGRERVYGWGDGLERRWCGSFDAVTRPVLFFHVGSCRMMVKRRDDGKSAQPPNCPSVDRSNPDTRRRHAVAPYHAAVLESCIFPRLVRRDNSGTNGAGRHTFGSRPYLCTGPEEIADLLPPCSLAIHAYRPGQSDDGALGLVLVIDLALICSTGS